ncbi:MAG TPA: chemotaxis protein CheB [Polyangiaceae bacterium]|nr:chemotaxis protein CheB [Polyangiaceae bacterium]
MKLALACAAVRFAEALHHVLLGGGHRVCGVAATREQVRELVQGERPDVLLLDVAWLGAGTAAFVRELMADSPCTILLCTQGGDDRLSQVYEAMGAGAIDVVAWSSGDAPSPSEVGQLLAKLSTVSKLLGDPQVPPSTQREPMLVAFGASTGGPQALVDVIKALPRDFQAAIVIVQHVDSEFAQGFAGWLQAQTSRPTELASLASVPKAGGVLVAATNDHLVMTAGRGFAYTPHPRELAYRPSVDVLFRSLAKHWRKPGVGVLLTGMGRDGADGLLHLRRAGWLTIAQDEKTSVVYGMPKAAVELGAAAKVLPLGDIARVIAAHKR